MAKKKKREPKIALVSEPRLSSDGGIDSATDRPHLQRVGEVRKGQGITPKILSKRTNRVISVSRIRELDDPTAEAWLSELYLIAHALEVPVHELFPDSGKLELAGGIAERAIMVRMMKTAQTILELAQHAESNRPQIRINAQFFLELLAQLSPDFALLINDELAVRAPGQLPESGAAAEGADDLDE